MSNVDPPLDVRNPGRLPGDLDGLLRAFFRAEVPHPWPAVRVPDLLSPFPQRNGAAAHLNGDDRRPAGIAARFAPRSLARVRSRLALAASLALLLLGTLLLSGKFHLNPRDADLGPPAAPRTIDPLIGPVVTPDIDLNKVHMRESIVQPGNQPTEYHIDMNFPVPSQP
jgi:hypothetical protein